MAKNNKKCLVCNKEYYYCSSCRNKPTDIWKNNYCCENCREIFMVVTDYLAGVLEEGQAKSRLGKCDLSGREKFTEVVKDVVDILCPVVSADNGGNEKTGSGVYSKTEKGNAKPSLDKLSSKQF